MRIKHKSFILLQTETWRQDPVSSCIWTDIKTALETMNTLLKNVKQLCRLLSSDTTTLPKHLNDYTVKMLQTQSVFHKKRVNVHPLITSIINSVGWLKNHKNAVWHVTSTACMYVTAQSHQFQSDTTRRDNTTELVIDPVIEERNTWGFFVCHLHVYVCVSECVGLQTYLLLLHNLISCLKNRCILHHNAFSHFLHLLQELCAVPAINA